MNNRGLEPEASGWNERTVELYTKKGDGWRLKWGAPKETISRGSEAIYLGIVTLLTNACQGWGRLATSLAIQSL